MREDEASCTQISGPNREFCHGTSGTTAILEFFQKEFNFNAQWVAAIMVAHSIGAMRRVNLRFEGRSGWDLTNGHADDLPKGNFSTAEAHAEDV